MKTYQKMNWGRTLYNFVSKTLITKKNHFETRSHIVQASFKLLILASSLLNAKIIGVHRHASLLS